MFGDIIAYVWLLVSAGVIDKTGEMCKIMGLQRARENQINVKFMGKTKVR